MATSRSSRRPRLRHGKSAPLGCGMLCRFRSVWRGAEKIDLVALKGAGHWGAAANFAAGEALDRVVIETADFQFIKVRSIHHPDFLPGGAKYGDIDSLLSLAENEPWRADGKGLPGWLR